MGPLTEEAACDVCSCTPEELCCGSLAGKPEGRYMDKLRTIHDATVNHVNKWIRHNSTEKTTAPGLPDLQYAIAQCDTGDTTMLKLDISKAHRRIRVLQKDWKYIAARIMGEIWLNLCGTYGVASAQQYWGRMAALILRLIYYTFPQILWAFVYVDDFIVLLPTHTATETAQAILTFLECLGCPISWKKTCMATRNHWLGYQILTTTNTAILTPDKQATMYNILQNILSGKTTQR